MDQQLGGHECVGATTLLINIYNTAKEHINQLISNSLQPATATPSNQSFRYQHDPHMDTNNTGTHTHRTRTEPKLTSTPPSERINEHLVFKIEK